MAASPCGIHGQRWGRMPRIASAGAVGRDVDSCYVSAFAGGKCMKRRDLLRSAVLGGAALVFAPARGVVAAADGNGAVDPSAIERRHGGRLGLAVLDTGSGRRLVWRGGERFLMCSTFKWL